MPQTKHVPMEVNVQRSSGQNWKRLVSRSGTVEEAEGVPWQEAGVSGSWNQEA